MAATADDNLAAKVAQFESDLTVEGIEIWKLEQHYGYPLHNNLELLQKTYQADISWHNIRRALLSKDIEVAKGLMATKLAEIEAETKHIFRDCGSGIGNAMVPLSQAEKMAILQEEKQQLQIAVLDARSAFEDRCWGWAGKGGWTPEELGLESDRQHPSSYTKGLAFAGHLELLKEGQLAHNWEDMVVGAAEGGQLHILKWCATHKTIHPNNLADLAISAALRCGQTACVEWLSTSAIGNPAIYPYHQEIWEAVAGTQLELVEERITSPPHLFQALSLVELCSRGRNCDPIILAYLATFLVGSFPAAEAQKLEEYHHRTDREGLLCTGGISSSIGAEWVEATNKSGQKSPAYLRAT